MSLTAQQTSPLGCLIRPLQLKYQREHLMSWLPLVNLVSPQIPESLLTPFFSLILRSHLSCQLSLILIHPVPSFSSPLPPLSPLIGERLKTSQLPSSLPLLPPIQSILHTAATFFLNYITYLLKTFIWLPIVLRMNSSLPLWGPGPCMTGPLPSFHLTEGHSSFSPVSCSPTGHSQHAMFDRAFEPLPLLFPPSLHFVWLTLSFPSSFNVNVTQRDLL